MLINNLIYHLVNIYKQCTGFLPTAPPQASLSRGKKYEFTPAALQLQFGGSVINSGSVINRLENLKIQQTMWFGEFLHSLWSKCCCPLCHII